MQTYPAKELDVPNGHGVQDDAPADDCDPAGHSEHFVAAVVLVYVPAKHDVQIDPAAMYCPILQDVHDDPPSDDDNPVGHFMHSVAVKVSV